MDKPPPRNITLMAWFNFFVDFTLYAPVAILYFARVTGSYALGLAVFSVEMVSASLFELPTGVLSDLAGRRKTVILGAACALVAGILYAAGGSAGMLFLGSAFSGLARAFYSGNNAALIHESLREQGREDEYAHFSSHANSMFQVALAASSLLGGLAAQWSFSLVMWLSVLPRLAGLVVAFRLVEPRVPALRSQSHPFSHLRESIDGFLHNKELRLLSLSSILGWGIGETLYQFQAVFIASLWPVWAVGLAKTLSHALAVAGMRLSHRICTKAGYTPTLLGASLLERLANIFSLLLAAPVSPAIMTATSFSFGVNMVAQDTLFQKHFSDRQRATMGSLTSLAGSLFFGLFAASFGLLADGWPPARAMLLGEVLLFSVPFILWRLFRHEKKHAAAIPMQAE